MVPISEQARQVERELWRRRRIDPSRVSRGVLSVAKARAEQGSLEAAIETLRSVAAAEAPDLFADHERLGGGR